MSGSRFASFLDVLIPGLRPVAASRVSGESGHEILKGRLAAAARLERASPAAMISSCELLPSLRHRVAAERRARNEPARPKEGSPTARTSARRGNLGWLTVTLSRMAGYDDGRVVCTEDSIILRRYSLWRARRIAYQAIR